MGKEGLTLAAIAALAMAAVAFFVAPEVPSHTDSGICFPSPDLWIASPMTGRIVNILLLGGVCLLLFAVNKDRTFIKGSDTVQLGMFLIMAASNVWVTESLNSGLLTALINLICLWIIFGCYDMRNSTREMFVTGTVLGIGSMFEYSVVFMTPVYIVGIAVLKSFSFRVLIAYLMGLLAPFWIVIGLGIVSPEAFAFPILQPFNDMAMTRSELLVGLLNVAFTVILGLSFALANSVRLYAGTSKRRLYNLVINILGVVALICIVFDFDNITAYLPTLYMVAAVQTGNFFELSNVYRGNVWVLALAALYVGAFVLMIVTG